MTPASTPEAELVSRARAGDRAAFGVLVERHQEIAFRTACVVCGDATDAQDAAQEALLKAYLALDRFRDGAPFRPWLLAIVANEARNRARSTGRRTALALRAGAALDEHAAPGADVAVLAGARRGTLLAALGRLGDEHRQVLTLRYLLDLSEAECAAILRCRPGTVKSRASRALGRLRAELGEEDR
ncbi:ECF RNA polymerase sigma-E factor [Baekduia alba]|uniref:RNA polymerase sigma factor n=1 Tax=Baekduia alba TaxID=2997333 RepID=UPI00234107B0|nr:RNA polymerase sigma factor [Baekduia alba]WCB96158.1 ECF RNA polymerase sigma-E factor [Baekduia alba]